jgi:hypothetical protein
VSDKPLILMPGQDPPEMWVYCQRCDMPVESLRFDVLDGTDRIGIHAGCCGQESSTRITLPTYLEMLATGRKLYVIVKKGSQAGLRGRSRHLRSVSH